MLLLLDLSAAFDTVDHGTLINTLENEVGVTGECLAWIQSYLEERQQRVTINNSRSDSRTLKCGVPQGSVLGPLLFSIYTIPLAAIMRKHGILYHLYADDTQLYLEFSLSDTTSRDNDIHRLEICIKDIRTWMRLNMLKLNDYKTEILIIYPKSSDLDSLPDSTWVISLSKQLRKLETWVSSLTPPCHQGNTSPVYADQLTFTCTPWVAYANS